MRHRHSIPISAGALDLVRHLPAVQPFTLEPDQHRPALVDRQRLRGNPGHPRPQVLAALGNGLRQRRGILGQPPAEEQPTRARQPLGQDLA
jgi:hypothetical protein